MAGYPVPAGYDFIPDSIAQEQEQYPYGQSRAGNYDSSGMVQQSPGVQIQGLLEQKDPVKNVPKDVQGAMGPNQALQWANEQLGLTPVSDINQLTAIVENAGADPNDPEVLAAMQSQPVQILYQGAFGGGPRQTEFRTNLFSWAASLAQSHPGVYQPNQYEQKVDQFGWDEPVPKGMLGIAAATPSGVTVGGGAVGVQKSPTGAKMFQNGVIFDPNETTMTGGPLVLFPEGDGSVAGSSAWLAKVQKNWSPDQIQAQTKELIKYGYLPKEYSKAKTLSVPMIQALREFHTNRYAYGNGRPVASDKYGGPAGGPEGIEQNLRQVRAGMAEGVKGQMQRVFGPDYTPSKDEIKEWTEFVIRMGNQMQRTKGMSAASASAEAMARAGQRLENMPGAQFDEDLMREEQENTQLRDGLATAAAATAGVIGWG